MQVWLGFLPYLTGESYGASGDLYQASTDGKYGRYYFPYDSYLVPFMQYCVNLTSYYADFQPYINMGVGNTQLIDNAGLIAVFRQYANAQPQHFSWCQDNYFYTTIVLNANAEAMDVNDNLGLNVNFNDLYNSGAIIGTFASFYYEQYITGVSQSTLDQALGDMLYAYYTPFDLECEWDMINAGYQVYEWYVAFYPWFQQGRDCISAATNHTDYYTFPQTEPTRPQPPTPPPPPPPVGVKGDFWHLWFNLGLWQNN